MDCGGMVDRMLSFYRGYSVAYRMNDLFSSMTWFCIAYLGLPDGTKQLSNCIHFHTFFNAFKKGKSRDLGHEQRIFGRDCRDSMVVSDKAVYVDQIENTGWCPFTIEASYLATFTRDGEGNYRQIA